MDSRGAERNTHVGYKHAEPYLPVNVEADIGVDEFGVAARTGANIGSEHRMNLVLKPPNRYCKSHLTVGQLSNSKSAPGGVTRHDK